MKVKVGIRTMENFTVSFPHSIKNVVQFVQFTELRWNPVGTYGMKDFHLTILLYGESKYTYNVASDHKKVSNFVAVGLFPLIAS